MDVGISHRTREWLLIAAMTAIAWLPRLLLGGVLIGSAVLLGRWALAVPPVAVGVFAGMLRDRRDGARLPGRAVRPGEEPELTELVRDVAERLGFRAPLLVRVVPVPQAALGPVKVSGVRAFALVLGLPLLRGLSAAQLAAVVAHELAHEQHVSDRRRALLAASREALADRLDGRFRPLAPLAAPLLRASQPRAWEPELAADADAARVAGAVAVRGALERTGPLGAAFEVLGGRWLSVLAEEDAYPADFYDALDAALTDPHVARLATRIAEDDHAHDSYGAASHPPDEQRIAALPDSGGEGSYGGEPVPLRSAEAIEQWCVDALAGLDDRQDHKPVRVLATGPGRFFRPAGEALAELSAATRRDTRAEALAAALDMVADGTWPRLARRLEPRVRWTPPAARTSAARTVVAGCVGRVVSDALLDADWEYQGRWLSGVVTAPDGTTVLDVHDMLTTALDTGDPGPVRELLQAAAGTGVAA